MAVGTTEMKGPSIKTKIKTNQIFDKGGGEGQARGGDGGKGGHVAQGARSKNISNWLLRLGENEKAK